MYIKKIGFFRFYLKKRKENGVLGYAQLGQDKRVMCKRKKMIVSVKVTFL